MQQLLSLLSDEPAMRFVQIGLLVVGALAVFLLCFATRDILLRTRSFLYQAFCIILVAVLPFVGFLLYLLIRPARTVKERENERMLKQILAFTEEAEVVSDDEEIDDDEEPPEEEEEAPEEREEGNGAAREDDDTSSSEES